MEQCSASDENQWQQCSADKPQEKPVLLQANEQCQCSMNSDDTYEGGQCLASIPDDNTSSGACQADNDDKEEKSNDIVDESSNTSPDSANNNKKDASEQQTEATDSNKADGGGKKWEDMTEEEQNLEVKRYCLHHVCENYKRVVDGKILSATSSRHEEFDGERFRDLVKGAADEYLDAILSHALKDVADERIKDEIFDLKDTLEVNFDEQFKRYFRHFEETDKDKVVKWSLDQGEILMEGYKENCKTFFTKADEALAKYNITLDLGPYVRRH